MKEKIVNPVSEMQDSSLNENWRELELEYYIPEELWPADATEIDDQPCHLHYRKSKWHIVENINEKNKKTLDEIVKWYKNKHPEIEDPLKDDNFWLHNVDTLIASSVKRRDYKYEDDYENANEFKRSVSQYDVFMQTTLGGWVTHPVFVYNISYQDMWMAYINHDDYAKEKLAEFDKSWGREKDNKRSLNDEECILWQTKGWKEERLLEINLIKEGHITFEIKYIGREYAANYRWVNHSDTSKNNGYGELHKTNW